MTVAWLETVADDKEDDYDVLDDKSPSTSSDFPQRIQTAYSFSFLAPYAADTLTLKQLQYLLHHDK